MQTIFVDQTRLPTVPFAHLVAGLLQWSCQLYQYSRHENASYFLTTRMAAFHHTRLELMRRFEIDIFDPLDLHSLRPQSELS